MLNPKTGMSKLDETAMLYNARIKEAEAELIRQARESETRIMNEELRKAAGTDVAVASVGDAEISSGSTLLAMSENIKNRSLDILEARKTRNVQETQKRYSAEVDKWKAKEMRKARKAAEAKGRLGGVGGIIGTVAGGVVGSMLGGPMGALKGADIGGTLLSGVGGLA
jgi:uncharacterized protein YcfJ